MLEYLFDLDTGKHQPGDIGPRVLAVSSIDEFERNDGDSSSKGKHIGAPKELLEKHPEFEEIFIDGTKQELPKPGDNLR